MLRTNLFFVITAMFLSSFSGLIAQNTDQYAVGYTENGKASYYGEKMHGKVTASGEVYDMFSMTAAHRELPFNTIIKVVNKNDPGTWVTLRVNDRGPFTKNRILDVSKRAALKLNMEKTGILDVQLEVLKLGDNKTVKSTAEDSTQVTALAKNEVDKAEENTEKKPVAKKEEKVVQKAAVKKPEIKAVNKAAVKTVAAKVDKNLPLSERFKKTGTYNVWGTPTNPSGYGLQLAAYSDITQALKVSNEAIGLGLDEVYIQTGWANNLQSYRIIWGSWDDKEAVAENMIIAKKKGFFDTFERAHFNQKATSLKN